jgi:hypothetical protein
MWSVILTRETISERYSNIQSTEQLERNTSMKLNNSTEASIRLGETKISFAEAFGRTGCRRKKSWPVPTSWTAEALPRRRSSRRAATRRNAPAQRRLMAYGRPIGQGWQTGRIYRLAATRGWGSYHDGAKHRSGRVNCDGDMEPGDEGMEAYLEKETPTGEGSAAGAATGLGGLRRRR